VTSVNAPCLKNHARSSECNSAGEAALPTSDHGVCDHSVKNHVMTSSCDFSDEAALPNSGAHSVKNHVMKFGCESSDEAALPNSDHLVCGHSVKNHVTNFACLYGTNHVMTFECASSVEAALHVRTFESPSSDGRSDPHSRLVAFFCLSPGTLSSRPSSLWREVTEISAIPW